LLTKKDEKYLGIEKSLEPNIPIIKKLEPVSTEVFRNEQKFQIKSFLSAIIDDKPNGEIISATKLSVYNQCPLKYWLIYQLGFSDLMVQNRDWLKRQNKIGNTDLFDFNPTEEKLLAANDEEISRIDPRYSQIKGTIIHKLLSDDGNKNDYADKLDGYLKDLIKKEDWHSVQFTELKEDIVRDLTKYFNSKSYEWIQRYPNYRNEFEIYHQHQDYYLYGIIDKLIVSKDKIIIVDYKTDSISPEEIQERANQYFPQLQFYSFIAGKLFDQKVKFELRIIFILHPDEVVTKTLEPDDVRMIKQNIELMVNKAGKGSSEKNLNHCKFCIFSINKDCIVT
jgi:ATP-dependent helicase/nuclease subunit A